MSVHCRIGVPLLRVGVLLAIASVCAFGQPLDRFDGYVTKIVSPSQLEVNGVPVLTTKSTKVSGHSGKSKAARADLNLYVGMPVVVHVKTNEKTATITATSIVVRPETEREVTGTGIVDAVLPSPAGAAEDHLIRADGYSILISTKTAITFDPPIDRASAFQTNAWVRFQGTQRADGVVAADVIHFQANTVSDAQEKVVEKWDYDPKAVDPDQKQNGWSKAFKGVDPKRLAPYDDAAMQSRVETIGAKLVPKFQRELSDADPAKIHFRFQVVDQSQWRDAVSLPSGVILVPHQVVEKMQNDAQLATVLADNIASVLEKQLLRALPGRKKREGAQLASDAAGIFVPGLGLAVLAANAAVTADQKRHFEDESGRVSLYLLHDAGYDVFEAPLAWLRLELLLAPDGARLPHRAEYLYKMLGEEWHGN